MGITNDQEILRLTEEEISKLKEEINEEKHSVSNKQRQLQEKIKKRQMLIERAKVLKNQLPEVTDHAVLRYLERIQGVDIEQIKRQILTPEVIDQMEILGTTGKFVTNNGLQVVAKNHKVLTVYGS